MTELFPFSKDGWYAKWMKSRREAARLNPDRVRFKEVKTGKIAVDVFHVGYGDVLKEEYFTSEFNIKGVPHYNFTSRHITREERLASDTAFCEQLGYEVIE